MKSKYSKIPNHKLVLKKKRGSIMLLRNIHHTLGLCNRIELIVQELTNNIIEKIIVTGNHISDKIYIPQINMIPSDPEIPLRFQRR